MFLARLGVGWGWGWGRDKSQEQGHSPAGQAGLRPPGPPAPAKPGQRAEPGRGVKARLPPHPPSFSLACAPSCCEQEEPTYFAIWGDNKAFNEVIISPAMLHEHLPYVVMEGLNKVRPDGTPASWICGPRLQARVWVLRGVSCTPSKAVGSQEPARVLASGTCSVTWPRGPW